MARTRALLIDTFQKDLAQIIEAYFAPLSADPKAIGRAGAWELSVSYTGDNEHLTIRGAIHSGYAELVETLLNLHNPHPGQLRLNCACFYGHHAIIDLLLARGVNDYADGLDAACVGGHDAIVHNMLIRIDDTDEIPLYGACRIGRRDLMVMLIDAHAHDWIGGFHGALDGDDLPLAQWILEIIKHDQNALDTCLYRACSICKWCFVQATITQGAKHCRCGRTIAAHLALATPSIKK